jgi:hypothetical protein
LATIFLEYILGTGLQKFVSYAKTLYIYLHFKFSYTQPDGGLKDQNM